MKSITERFQCEHKSTRLLNLKPGAIIRQHKDADLDFEHGEARIHVPIITNPQVEFFIDDERLDLKAGECWYMNFGLPHRIANFGSTDRVHLVMDIVVNDRIRELFDQAEPGSKKIMEFDDQPPETERRMIIERLLEMNTPVSIQMAKDMEATLK